MKKIKINILEYQYTVIHKSFPTVTALVCILKMTVIKAVVIDMLRLFCSLIHLSMHIY